MFGICYSLVDILVYLDVLEVFEHLGALFLVVSVSGVEYASDSITEDADPCQPRYVKRVAYAHNEDPRRLKHEEQVLKGRICSI